MTDEDLLATIELIRSESYPDLPADLIREIIEIESQFIDDRDKASLKVNAIIDQYLGRL